MCRFLATQIGSVQNFLLLRYLQGRDSSYNGTTTSVTTITSYYINLYNCFILFSGVGYYWITVFNLIDFIDDNCYIVQTCQIKCICTRVEFKWILAVTDMTTRAHMKLFRALLMRRHNIVSQLTCWIYLYAKKLIF